MHPCYTYNMHPFAHTMHSCCLKSCTRVVPVAVLFTHSCCFCVSQAFAKAAKSLRGIPPEDWGLSMEETLRRMKHNAYSKVYHGEMLSLQKAGMSFDMAKVDATTKAQAASAKVVIPLWMEHYIEQLLLCHGWV